MLDDDEPHKAANKSNQKGVLLPERVMTAQAKSLLQAWEYSASDHLLHVLPLHHIHGTINALFTPLFAGSSIEFLFPFNADWVWRRFAAPFLPATTETEAAPAASKAAKDVITFFTVVPTVYSRLLATHKGLTAELQRASREAISPAHLRVNISGSAALPTPIKKAWEDLSHGNVLLERFGMTEVGMALSCGLDDADRIDGSVGWPLPSVEARLVDVDTGDVIPPGEAAAVAAAGGRERAGEIQLRGPTVFPEYWRNPEATAKEFVDAEDGGPRWFKTGDVAVRRPAAGAGLSARASQRGWARGDAFFVLGRRSADIIKSGGEKVSALEVERELLSLPQVAEAAVVAVPSGKWGQKVGAVVVLDRDAVPAGRWTPLDMRRALKRRLVNYKIPQVLRVVDHIPRNAMGKINKRQLVGDVFQEDFSGDEAAPPPAPPTPSVVVSGEKLANGDKVMRLEKGVSVVDVTNGDKPTNGEEMANGHHHETNGEKLANGHAETNGEKLTNGHAKKDGEKVASVEPITKGEKRTSGEELVKDYRHAVNRETGAKRQRVS